jgi:SRSO17 transposase
MVSRTSDWRDELGRWLKLFLDRLGHKARRQMCPLYVSGLIGPGDRKSVQPMAKRLALSACRCDAARVAFVRLGRAFPPALPTLARLRRL